MIQYGDIRHFTTDGVNTIKAVPKFAVPIDPDLEPDALIASVVITGMNGEQAALEKLKAHVQQLYVGAKYSTWKAHS